jgi:hypothetical protein
MDTSLGVGPPGDTGGGTRGRCLGYESERDLVARCIAEMYQRCMRSNEAKRRPHICLRGTWSTQGIRECL